MATYYSQLDPEQQHMVDLGLRLSRGDPRKIRKSLLEAMIVESSLRNLDYGDRDSEGVLQQRPSTGWGPASESAKTDILQYLARARQTLAGGFQGGAGALAQAVQRSAFPGRYREHAAEAAALLKGAPVGPLMGGPGYGAPASYGSRGDKRAAVQGANRELALQLLGMTSSYGRSRDASGLLMAAGAARQAQSSPVTPYSPANYAPFTGGYPGGISPMILKLARRFGLDITSGLRTPAQNAATGGAPGSYHLQGRAGDVDPQEGRIQDFIRFAKNHPGKFMEFFYDPLGWYIKNGEILQGAIGGHDDHLHYAI